MDANLGSTERPSSGKGLARFRDWDDAGAQLTSNAITYTQVILVAIND